MDQTLFITGFALVMGAWNVWTFRKTKGRWFWVGLGIIAFAIAIFVLEKVLGIGVFYTSRNS